MSAGQRRIGRGHALGLIGAIGVVWVALDQAVKAMAVAWLDPARPVDLVGDWLQLRLLRNPGAAFGQGADWTVGFAVLALAVLVVGLIWAARRVRCRAWAWLAGLAAGGVAGNLIDRLVRPPGVWRGHVIDFLSLKHFAVFNLADVGLTVAAGVLIVFVLTGRTDPAGSEPDLESALESDGDEPAGAEPVGTDPVGVDPAETDRSGADPAPVAAEPGGAEPAGDDLAEAAP
ncbi:MAG: signal peptidase II [Propionibacteriaceae bacterium]|nr:signal peptidase II [Propionibacteriaceae bacterium]